MQNIELSGLYTYIDNIRTLKLGDRVKLKSNPHNRLSKDAIGVYTLNGEKIGYTTFKANQIDITSTYTITKINMIQSNPILLISREYNASNIIPVEPPFIKTVKYNNLVCKTKLNDEELNSIKRFTNYLIREGNIVQELKITFQDDNYINILIRTNNNKMTFLTVTRKYYEENIFIYDEFYKYKLIPKCIYEPYLIHRLENYIENNYKNINKLLKMKKFKYDNLLKGNIFEFFDKITNINYGFDKINISILPTQILNILNKIKNNTDLIKLIIQYKIKPNKYYDPINFIKYHSINTIFSYEQLNTINLDKFINIFNNIKLGGICYNHKLKSYCYIDLYDDINIVDIITENIISDNKFMEVLLKLIIADKQIINLYNPINEILFRLEIPDFIKEKVMTLLVN